MCFKAYVSERVTFFERTQQFQAQKEFDDGARFRHRAAFNEACRAAFASLDNDNVLLWFAEDLAHPDFPLEPQPGARYTPLFDFDPRFDARRQSLLFPCGNDTAPAQRAVARSLERHTGEEDTLEALQRWQSAFRTIYEQSFDAPEVTLRTVETQMR